MNQLRYAPYALGLLEMETLKKEQQTRLGEDFDELAFHTAILKRGGAPFSVLGKWLAGAGAD